jgi:hypothetical protein
LVSPFARAGVSGMLNSSAAATAEIAVLIIFIA